MKRIFFGLVIAAFFIGVGIAFLSRGPNFPVEMVRTLNSDRPTADLLHDFNQLENWPIWHHYVKKAEGKLATGSELKFTVVPKGYSWRLYVLTTQVEAFEPGKSVALVLKEDGSGKLSRQFSDLKWSLSIGDRTLGLTPVTVKISAMTQSARARFFCRLDSKLLLSQALLPDVFVLGGQSAPEGLELTPH